ncbi:hypothetical protein [Paraburkholderia sacchari]|uniref:hypothetical protein n=1 Tax=Paraburkholderia sacchari TaxID=159450 RepID=UPI003D958027
MKVPLTTGAYTAKSLVAEAQRCVNLYAERNPQDAAFPFTYYLSPGLTLKATATDSGWRGLFSASNGVTYGVCGSSVYRINSDFTLKLLGSIGSISGPVSIVDNATYAVIVDGSPSGYTIKLANDAFSLLLDSSFVGGNTVNFVDGFLVLNYPATNEWYISLNNEISFDSTDFASKSGFSDKLVGIGITKRYIYLLGKLTTEVWFNAGDTTFPFERLPGVFMQHGCAAVGSIAQMDGEIYWLAQSQQGVCYVNRSQQFNASQISTLALDNELATYSRVDDAIGFTYQIEGHFFYVLTFPTADKTWQYDLSTGQWNELNWIDSNGQLHRHRANCYASAYGQPIVGDWQNGNLYLWDVNSFTDNGNPIPRIRSFPHGVDDSSNRIHYQEFIANMEVGNGANNAAVPVSLRWSDSRGVSWGNPVMRSLGMEGEYLQSVQWRRLGMARDRVFEISWSAPTKTALMGAWVDAQSNNQ